MKATVILCLLGLMSARGDILKDFHSKFNWNGVKPGSGPSREIQTPNSDNVCRTDQAACGCCLMLQQIERMKKNFNESLAELTNALNRATANLEQFRSGRTAFSVALITTQSDNYYGPYRDDHIIRYKHVFLNMGDHYNTNTGVFLVPSTGVYSVALTVYSDSKGPGNTLKACASIQVNGKEVSKPREFYLQDQEDSATSSILIRLKRGDKVWVALPIGCFLYDDGSHYNTFSMFLLYFTEDAA